MRKLEMCPSSSGRSPSDSVATCTPVSMLSASFSVNVAVASTRFLSITGRQLICRIST